MILAFLMIIGFIAMTAAGLYRSTIADGAVYAIIGVAVAILIFVIILSLRQKRLSLEDVSAYDTNMANKPNYVGGQLKSVDDSNFDSSVKDNYDILWLFLFFYLPTVYNHTTIINN